MKKKKLHSYWIIKRISWILNIVLIAALGTALLPRIYQDSTDSRRGVIGISGTHVQWLTTCPRHKYSSYLSDLDVRIQYYGLVQLEDDVWLCGGHGDRDDQNRTCLILSLVYGRWRTLEHKMIHPRKRPVMLVDQGAVIVMSGVTTDVNSNTGCRDTQEVRTSNN